MEEIMSPKLWSDEERLFIPRAGGWSINFKHIARKLGWVKPLPVKTEAVDADPTQESTETPEDRLRRSVERSKFEKR
jgi:hypothetical protein